jgi:hypothetical protein
MWEHPNRILRKPLHSQQVAEVAKLIQRSKRNMMNPFIDYYPGTNNFSKSICLPYSSTIWDTQNSGKYYNQSPLLEIDHCIQLWLTKVIKEGS